MLAAGQRNNRVRFERRTPGEKSASGNVLLNWSSIFERWAGFRPQFGSERLEQGRVTAGLRGVLTVLSCPETQGLTEADRVAFIAGPYRDRLCNITSISPRPDGREIEMTIETSTEN